MKFCLLIPLLFLTTFLVGQNTIALVHSSPSENTSAKIKSDKKVFEATFEMHDRIILVEAEMNGILGKYILDTGSPTLIINQKVKNTTQQLFGVTQNCAAKIVDIENFTWAGISKKSIEAVAVDLSDLEKSLGTKINGLIGQEIFGDYELYLDLSKKIIQLHRPTRSTLHKNNQYQQKISFATNNHIPIITVKIDGKKYRFGIDTGAEVNVLNQDLKDKLGTSFLKDIQTNNINGVDGISQEVPTAQLLAFEIKKQSFQNFEFFFLDLTQFADDFNRPLDGILGYPFLVQNSISINYYKQKIYFW